MASGKINSSGVRVPRRRSDFQLFGIFGYPLSHTLSPAMHEAAFSKLGIDAAYIVLEMMPGAFRGLMAHRSGLTLSGYNVTVPYKETVLKYLDVVSPEARAIGAVNTVYRLGKRWAGANTDMEGFLLALTRDGKFRPRAKHALVLGAGGAARAVVYGLSRSGVKDVTVTDCFPEKARKVVKDMEKAFPGRSYRVLEAGVLQIKDAVEKADVIINATPLGLKGSDPRVIPGGWVPPARAGKKVFMDLIYNPAETLFLRTAREKGHRILNGLGMLLYQGARAFELWTGRPAPVEIMRQALSRALEGKGKDK